MMRALGTAKRSSLVPLRAGARREGPTGDEVIREGSARISLISARAVRVPSPSGRQSSGKTPNWASAACACCGPVGHFRKPASSDRTRKSRDHANRPRRKSGCARRRHRRAPVRPSTSPVRPVRQPRDPPARGSPERAGCPWRGIRPPDALIAAWLFWVGRLARLIRTSITEMPKDFASFSNCPRTRVMSAQPSALRSWCAW